MRRRQFAVIGLGKFGFHVAQALSQAGCEVMAIDTDSEKVQSVSEFVAHALQCDASDEKAIREAGVQNMDVAIVSVGGNLEASILIVMNLRELGMKEIIAKATSPIHGKVLNNLGVKRVIYPEKESAVRVAHSLVTPNLLEYLELAPGYSIAEIPVPRALVEKTLRESQIRALYGVNIIAIRKSTLSGMIFNTNPGPDDVLASRDVIVIIGRDEDIQKLSNLQ
ncbi:TrkA family potassium uptake protein [Candidatus Acetothermia bacterium]|nr:TrkA family potassium uptake protein [Candidatus Acetothermia bacterium]